MSVSICRIRQDNRHLLLTIADEVFDAPIDPVHLDRYLADPSQLLFVACEHGCVIGQTKSVLHRHPDKPPSLFVDEIGVTPAQQRRGIASSLLSAVVAAARNLGCTEVWLATEPDNEPANQFYKAIEMRGEHVVVYSTKV